MVGRGIEVVSTAISNGFNRTNVHCIRGIWDLNDYLFSGHLSALSCQSFCLGSQLDEVTNLRDISLDTPTSDP